MATLSRDGRHRSKTNARAPVHALIRRAVVSDEPTSGAEGVSR